MRLAAFYENLAACGDLSATLDEAVDHGLEAIYISGGVLRDHPELPALFSGKGLPIEGLHQHFDFAHNPLDRSYRGYVDLAAANGASSLLVVPGFIRPGEDRARLLGNMVAAVRDCAAYGKERGVTVCMEPFDHMDSPTRNAAGLLHFLDSVPDLACAFDTGNFICDSEDPLSLWPMFAGRTCLLHLKDRYPRSSDGKGVLCSDGMYCATAPVGSGIIPVRAFLQEAVNVNAVIELYGCDDVMPALRSSLAFVRACLGGDI